MRRVVIVLCGPRNCRKGQHVSPFNRVEGGVCIHSGNALYCVSWSWGIPWVDKALRVQAEETLLFWERGAFRVDWLRSDFDERADWVSLKTGPHGKMCGKGR